jgi:hypothetical protein
MHTRYGYDRTAAWCALALCVAVALAPSLGAQGTPAPDSAARSDTSMQDMPDMPGMSMQHTTPHAGPMAGMAMRPGPLGISESREGSGTSWIPDASPMHARHLSVGQWEVMLHGVEFFEYDRAVGGARGADQFGGIGWMMGMQRHAVGAGTLAFREMLSADPWTVTERGYPLLLQSGEAYDGAPLHDRQHPHDLFMELAALYTAPVTRSVGIQLYAAPVGEPALGPVAFPHRPSASSDPYAPLGHHWQDATHIAYGVLTAGVFTSKAKLEFSLFNGREPDQHRADFDFTQHSPTLDSYSGRLTINPAARWSLSTWYAYLRSPEALAPTMSLHRLGASILNERSIGRTGAWSSAFVWGANLASNDARLSNSALVETNIDLDGANTFFGRLEYVDKLPEDLDVPIPAPPLSNRFDIGALAIGYVREIGPFTRYGAVGIGCEISMDAIPPSLRPYYGSRTPYGFGLFLRLRPSTGTP